MQLSLNNSIQETEVVQEKKQPVIKSKWDYQIAVKTLEAMYLNGMSFYPSIEDALRDLYPLYPSFEYKVDAILEKVIAERGSNFEEKFIKLYKQIKRLKFYKINGSRQNLFKLTYEICILSRVKENYSLIGVDVKNHEYILINGSRAYKLFNTEDSSYDEVKKFYNDFVVKGYINAPKHKATSSRAFAYNILTGQATDSSSKIAFDNLLVNLSGLLSLRTEFGIESLKKRNDYRVDTYFVSKDSGKSKATLKNRLMLISADCIDIIAGLKASGQDNRIKTVLNLLDKVTSALAELRTYSDMDLLIQSNKYRNEIKHGYTEIRALSQNYIK